MSTRSVRETKRRDRGFSERKNSVPLSPWSSRRSFFRSSSSDGGDSPIHSPKFNRLAASLRIPHYFGQRRISGSSRCDSDSGLPTPIPAGGRFRPFATVGLLCKFVFFICRALSIIVTYLNKEFSRSPADRWMIQCCHF